MKCTFCAGQLPAGPANSKQKELGVLYEYLPAKRQTAGLLSGTQRAYHTVSAMPTALRTVLYNARASRPARSHWTSGTSRTAGADWRSWLDRSHRTHRSDRSNWTAGNTGRSRCYRPCRRSRSCRTYRSNRSNRSNRSHGPNRTYRGTRTRTH